jgi:hypothetical protein
MRRVYASKIHNDFKINFRLCRLMWCAFIALGWPGRRGRVPEQVAHGRARWRAALTYASLLGGQT